MSMQDKPKELGTIVTGRDLEALFPKDRKPVPRSGPGGAPTIPTPSTRSIEAIRKLLETILRGEGNLDRGLEQAVDDEIAKIDRQIEKRVNAVLHDPIFQRLEGTWRGIHHLVSRTERSRDIRIELLHATRSELRSDLRREFRRTDLYRKMYTQRSGVLGGIPVASMIVDEHFSHDSNDIKVLEKLAQIGAASHTVVLAGVAPSLFGVESFADFGRVDPRNVPGLLATDAHNGWNSFREHPDSQFVGLVGPRVMARLPYGAGGLAVESFEQFQEVPLRAGGKPGPIAHDQVCWMNGAFVQGANMGRAYWEHGWCTAIAGINDGGMVEKLPNYAYLDERGGVTRRFPVETELPHALCKALAIEGMISVVQDVSKDCAVVMEVPTVHKPERYDDPDATRNASIAADLSYVMAISRVSHFLKVAGQHWLQSFKERADVEKELNRWIHQYVSADKNPSEEEKKRFPFAEATIEVEEDPEEPGHYRIIARLRPWLKVKQLSISLRLVAGRGIEGQQKK